MEINLIGQKFKHNCDECVYLGSITHKGEHNDLYFHDDPTNPILLARYGKSDAYVTVSKINLSLSQPLIEAKHRAIQRGLYKQPHNQE